MGFRIVMQTLVGRNMMGGCLQECFSIDFNLLGR